MDAIAIAASGMQASIARLNGSASNVANINTTGRRATEEDESTAYQPVDIVQTAVAGGGVTTTPVYRRPASVALYAPDSPDADDSGMVATPNVDPVTETVDQIKAARAYTANLSVMRTANQMSRTILDMKA